MPTFSNLGKNWYSDVVPENIELHSPLSVQIQASSPMSRKLIYSIVKGNEMEEFSVDFNTGMYEDFFRSLTFFCVAIISKHSSSLLFPATLRLNANFASLPQPLPLPITPFAPLHLALIVTLILLLRFSIPAVPFSFSLFIV